MMKKVPRFTHCCFALLLDLLVDVKDEPSWHSTENFLDWEWGTDNCKFGCDFLRRFSKALGGKTVAHIAIEQLDAYLDDHMWEKRHAALTALVCISKGCSKVMIKYLKRVLSMVLYYLQDSHPRVRWAAIRSISELSIDLYPDLQEHHNRIVPALTAALDDLQNLQVQAVAAVAVKNFFCNYEKPETLLSYLDAMLNKLLLLLQYDNQMVQEKTLDALASVAWSSKEHFQKYYDHVMPYLKTILINANDKSNHVLRSNALGCISMVGLAVGREKFRDDIYQVIEVLKSSQESHPKEFGSLCYILEAWVRIRSCMGKDFLPYMSTVMPLLVKCAQVQPNNITDGLNNSVHEVKFGNKMIYTKESDFLKVKSLACGMFGSYAAILEEDFYPWISQVTIYEEPLPCSLSFFKGCSLNSKLRVDIYGFMKQAISILVPLLKFYIHDDVRKEASTALYWMLKSAKLAVERGTAQGENGSYFKQLSCDIILALGDALDTEPETKVCAEILLSLLDCLEICGPTLSVDLLPSIVDVIKHVITESSCRREELGEREKSEDFDAEEAELLREETEIEENIHQYVGLILSSLVETFKAAFLPFFEELSSYLMPTRGKDKTTGERITSIVIFDELVGRCGEAALKYYNIYLPFLLDSSNDENLYARQGALCGVGLCAEHGVSIFKPFVGEALQRIIEVITHIHAREHEYDAYDYAVFALGKICQFHRESIDSAKIIPTWLNCLPMKSDEAEARVVHNQLCSMVERLDRELLGPEYEHFPKILSVFAEVLCAGKDLASEDTTNRMINVLRNLRKIIPPATWASAWSFLLPQQVMELEFVLSRNWNPFYHFKKKLAFHSRKIKKKIERVQYKLSRLP